jgi:hypothetical protein
MKTTNPYLDGAVAVEHRASNLTGRITMRKTLSVVCVSLALSFPAYADDAHHPESQQDKSAAAVKPPVKAVQNKPKAPKAARATDGGMECPMHKDGMGMMSHGGGGGDHEAMMARMHQMEKRMDMMQMMMEKMMKSGGGSGEAMPGMSKP